MKYNGPFEYASVILYLSPLTIVQNSTFFMLFQLRLSGKWLRNGYENVCDSWKNSWRTLAAFVIFKSSWNEQVKGPAAKILKNLDKLESKLVTFCRKS